MSTQRFPRTKYVRALIRIEDELEQWIAVFEGQGQFNRSAAEQDALLNRAQQLRVLAAHVHRLADDFAVMPYRMRDLRVRNTEHAGDAFLVSYRSRLSEQLADGDDGVGGQ